MNALNNINRPVTNLSTLRKFAAASLLTAGLAGLVLTQNGCFLAAVGAAGAATYAYVDGDAVEAIEAPLPDAINATKAAFEDMKAAVDTYDPSSVPAKVFARTASDKHVKVQLRRVTDTVTKVQVRVDTLGDETLSHEVINRIKGHLGKPITVGGSTTDAPVDTRNPQLTK